MAGVLYTVPAFLIWGITPVYWKQLKDVPSFEILMHRMIWSFLFILPLLLIQRRGAGLFRMLKDPKIVAAMFLSTCMVAVNWFLFIWAINHDRILQTSLGYYINPLVNVFLGTVFLKERLRPPQAVALLFAATGVGFMTVHYGELPWIALSLAFTFGFYGLIRKVAAIGAMEGLGVETFLLSIPAAAYLLYIDSSGQGAFLRGDPGTDLLLMGAALATGLPLLLFNKGARRIDLKTVGFLQYIAPSCTFLLAVFIYNEPVSGVQLFTFILIWIALALYSTDSIIFYNHAAKRTVQRV